MKRADIVAGFLGLGLCFFVLYLTAGFPEDQVVRVGPAFFPRLLAVGLGLFSLVLLVSALFQKAAEGEAGFTLKDPGIQRGIISVAATVLYCFVLDYLGFIACTIVYLLFLMFLLKERKYLQMAVTSISVSVVVFFIFKVLLNITLPMGTLYGL